MEHPRHIEDSKGKVIKPLKARWLIQRKVEKECLVRNGHWWHPEDYSIVDWFCCQCGKEREGMPDLDER